MPVSEEAQSLHIEVRARLAADRNKIPTAPYDRRYPRFAGARPAVSLSDNKDRRMYIVQLEEGRFGFTFVVHAKDSEERPIHMLPYPADAPLGVVVRIARRWVMGEV